jgi:hypothetical protein
LFKTTNSSTVEYSWFHKKKERKKSIRDIFRNWKKKTLLYSLSICIFYSENFSSNNFSSYMKRKKEYFGIKFINWIFAGKGRKISLYIFIWYVAKQLDQHFIRTASGVGVDRRKTKAKLLFSKIIIFHICVMFRVSILMK